MRHTVHIFLQSDILNIFEKYVVFQVFYVYAGDFIMQNKCYVHICA